LEEEFAAVVNLPPTLIVFLAAMIPLMELRGSIPLGFILGMDWPLIFVVSILGNLLPIPFILLFLRRMEPHLRKIKFVDRLMDRIFERTRRKVERKRDVVQDLGLMFFVAIPLPVTGAWTGALIAYMYAMDRKKSFLLITGGVLIAGTVVTAIMLLGVSILAWMV